MAVRALTLPAATAAAVILASSATAQQTLDDYLDAPPAVGEDAEPQAPDAPALFGGETRGYAAEEYYWMNPEAGRWPDDLDPRPNEYLPSPEPNVTFELDLGL